MLYWQKHHKEATTSIRSANNVPHYHVKNIIIKVLRVYVQDNKETNYLSQLEKENIYDFWSDTKAEHHVDIMTSPDLMDNLESRLKEHNVNWTVL